MRETDSGFVEHAGEWRFARPVVAWSVSFAVVTVVGVWLVGELAGIDQSAVSRDTVAVLNVPTWIGALSNLGVVGWVAGSAVSVFAALSVRPSTPESQWLLALGSFTGFLGLDDLYLVHERLIPKFLAIPPPVALALYAVAALGLVLRFRGPVRRSTLRPAWIAAGAFAVSLMGDVVLPDSHYVEDAAKFVGIVAIVAYQVILAADVTRGRWREGPAA